MSKKHTFHCPVSPHVAWSWGLVYQECPVVSSERDSEECRTCPLRGTGEFRKEQRRQRRNDDDRPRRPKRKSGTHSQQDNKQDRQKTFVG